MSSKSVTIDAQTEQNKNAFPLISITFRFSFWPERTQTLAKGYKIGTGSLFDGTQIKTGQ